MTDQGSHFSAIAVLRRRFGWRYMLMLEADRTDAAIMAELSELRQVEEKLDEELRDPESDVSLGYVYIAGERPFPTASHHVHLSLREEI